MTSRDHHPAPRLPRRLWQRGNRALRGAIESAWRWPLLLPALGALAGIMAADHFRWLPGWLWLPAGGLLALLAAAIWPGRVRWPVIAALAAGAFAFGHQQQLQRHAGHQQLLDLAAADAADVTGERRLRLTGVVVEPPLELTGSNERWSVVVRSEHWQDLHSGVDSDAPLRFRVRFEGPAPDYGDRVSLTGQLRRPGPAAHPWQRDPAQLAERLGLSGEVRVRGVGAWQRLETGRASWWKARALASRAWIERQLEQGMDHRPERVGVVKAMVLGLKREAPWEVEAAFRHSGSLHLFAVSGLHVGMVGLIAALVLQWCGVGVRRRALVIAAAALGYAFVTGWSPSAARASIMLAVVMWGLHLERPAASLNSLAAAVLLLLAADTQRLFQIGFQLSCLVVAGILVGAGWFRLRLSPLAEPDPFMPRALIGDWGRRWWHVKRWAIGLAAMSAAAWLASSPLMWFHFQLLAPSGLAANLVLVPLGFVVMSAAAVSMAAGLLPLPLGWLQLAANHAAAATGALLTWLAAMFSGLPGGSVYVPWPPLQADRPGARIEVMEPGFGGGAALLQSGTRSWLLDGGSVPAWHGVTDRLLARRGINRLDGIWLSHGDAGHAGGLEHVFDWRRVDLLWAPPMDRRSRGGRLVAELEEAGSDRAGPPWHRRRMPAIRRLEAGAVVPLHDGRGRGLAVTAHVLHPSPGWRAADSDDGAMVVRFDVGPWRVLWLNDAGWNTETLLVETLAPEELAADVVIKGWHGRDDSGVDRFWRTVSPRVVVAGEPGPREGRGRERLFGLWQDLGAAVFDQAESGYVSVDLWTDRMVVSGWLDRRERVLVP